MSNSCFSLVAPFLPVELLNRGISEDTIGFIFSIYSLARIVSSPFIGILLGKFDKRRVLSVGMGILALSISALGLMNTVENK